MRTLIQAPPKHRRPDSQDPIVFDAVTDQDQSLEVGGWGIAMESNPNYSEVVETWRGQSPFIQRIYKHNKEKNNGNE